MTSCGSPSNRGPAIDAWSCDPELACGGADPVPGERSSRRPAGEVLRHDGFDSGLRERRLALRTDVAGLLRDDDRGAGGAGEDVGHAAWGCNYMTSCLLYFGKRS